MAKDASTMCGLCDDVLEELCKQPTGQEWCERRERYHEDASYGPDDVLYDITKRLTQQQIEAVKEGLVVSGKYASGTFKPGVNRVSGGAKGEAVLTDVPAQGNE